MGNSKYIKPLSPEVYGQIIALALDEDLSYGDITTDNLSFDDLSIDAELIAKQNGILAGSDIFTRVFMMLDENVNTEDITFNVIDGDYFEDGDIIANLELSPATLLRGERVALNFLTHLCGVATFTNYLVRKMPSGGPQICDTRKTIPGLRALQKYAVRVGGGMNHRQSLSHMVLIKNNHIALAGGISNAVSQVRENVGHTVKIEVEAIDLDDVRECLNVDVDIIMLDNFSPEQAREAVRTIDRRAIIELSGGIDRRNIEDYVNAGVDLISIGALTHSVKSIDLAIHV